MYCYFNEVAFYKYLSFTFLFNYKMDLIKAIKITCIWSLTAGNRVSEYAGYSKLDISNCFSYFEYSKELFFSV